MYRQMFIGLVLVGVLLTVAIPAVAASPVDHYNVSFSEVSSGSLASDLAGCVGYAGTIWEDRHYDVQVTEFVEGPRQGRLHLRGVVSGEFTITPEAEENGPTYNGSYKEEITFIGTSFDDPLIAAFVLPATATGSDGSSLKFLMHGHLVIGPDGDDGLMKFTFTCIR